MHDYHHQQSYVDTYDPANKDDMYTNTTQPPDTMNPSESDYYM